MAGTNVPLGACAAGPEALPSIRDGIITRWCGAGLAQRGSRIDAAVDVGGNEITLTGTALTPADRDLAAALAAADSLELLIADRIRLPSFGGANQVRYSTSGTANAGTL